MNSQIPLLIGFVFFILLALLADLKLFHAKAHQIKMKEALLWSAFWIVLALLFNLLIYLTQGTEPALNFLTGYLLEKSLSVDNLFVFLLIFSYFKIPPAYLHRVLFWGILGALITRGIFIAGGIALVQEFHWTLYLLGAFLVIAGIKLALEQKKEVSPEDNFILKLCKKVLPITHSYDGDKLFTKIRGKYYGTPLFVALIAIETTDIIFAMDSIPAILAITLDPFIVYSSNIFAILGLRALYFAMHETMSLFIYLHYGLAAILAFIGVKLLLQDVFFISTGITFIFISGALTASVLVSVLKGNQNNN